MLIDCPIHHTWAQDGSGLVSLVQLEAAMQTLGFPGVDSQFIRKVSMRRVERLGSVVYGKYEKYGKTGKCGQVGLR